MPLSHGKSPDEAGLLESRGAISSSALASSNGRSSNASKGTTNRPLELSNGEHRPDRVVNRNDIREKNQSWSCELKSFGYLKLRDEQLNTEFKYA